MKFALIKSDGVFKNLRAAHEWLDRMCSFAANGEYELILKKKTKKRSIAQNRLLWLWFACISDETGNTSADVHDYYCNKFLSRVVKIGSDEMVIGGSTSKLTSTCFAKFLNDIQADAASELGITLPVPSDLYFSDFEARYQAYMSDAE
jgi:hypothetical protein